MRSWGSIDEKIRFRDKVKVLDTFFFGKIRLLVRKLGTMLNYFRMGFSLGSSKVQNVNHLVGEVHGNVVDVNRFLKLFPSHCEHVKVYSNMYIVYLHKVASGACGS